MRNNRSVLFITAIALILLALVPAVSANTIIYDRDLNEYINVSTTGEQKPINPDAKFVGGYSGYIAFADITKAQDLKYLIIEIPGEQGYWRSSDKKIEEGWHDIQYRYKNKVTWYPGVLYLNRNTDSLGQVTSTTFTVFLNDWDIGDRTGKQIIELSFEFTLDRMQSEYTYETNAYLHTDYSYEHVACREPITITEVVGMEWKHHIRVEEDSTSYYIYINGFIDGYRHTSQVKFSKGGNVFTNITNEGDEIYRAFVKDEIDLVEIISPGGTVYAYPIYSLPEDPTQPVEFRPFDINGNVPLNGVQITVYTCDPATFEPGTVVDIFTVNYGETISLPRGYYCISASYTDYNQVYPISETRFSNVDGPAIALIPMEREEEPIDPNQPVKFQPFDINGYVPLNGVQITVYECDPVTFEPGSVVDTFTVDYGETISLPRGYYCIAASYTDYNQVYPISETRFSNLDGPAIALIPMGKEEDIVTYQPVEFQPFDINGYVPLNGVQITVYECDPVTFEPGSVIDTFTVDYGETRSLPSGHYCIAAFYTDYNQVYPIADTRVSNVDGPAIALIPMEYVGEEETTVEVRIIDVDTEEPLQNVRLRIYEALPNFQQGRLVKEVTVNSGDHISLPAGRYFGQAFKSGYTQYFEVTNTRVTVDPPYPSILYIPMTSRDGITHGEGSFLDQSIEGIANLFGVSFGIGKTILGMLLALGIGTATAKHLRGGAQEFGLGMLGGVVLGVLIGLLPIWVLVLLVLIVGLWIGQRYMSGGES